MILVFINFQLSFKLRMKNVKFKLCDATRFDYSQFFRSKFPELENRHINQMIDLIMLLEE